jgi:hypothetical protein
MNEDGQMNSDARVVASSDALAADVEDEVVLLNMATGYFHQLNAVGSYLWKRLAEPQTIAELCASALHDFEADEEVCEQDVIAFVQGLSAAGLVHIE